MWETDPSDLTADSVPLRAIIIVAVGAERSARTPSDLTADSVSLRRSATWGE